MMFTSKLKKPAVPKPAPKEVIQRVPRGNGARRDALVVAKMLSPLGIVFLTALWFEHFVIEAVETNLIINGLIIVTMIYGAVLILARLMGALEDFRIIERFGREAANGVPMKELLEEPWIRHRYVRHYLKHIALTEGALTSQLDQNAIESELHALAAEYNSKLELPQFLVGFMIALGLLGTFIGLLETLTGISGMLDGMGQSTENIDQQFIKLVGELRKPLAGMGIAFSASMFGLIGSLMLAIMMINLRRFVSRVVMIARNVMHDLTHIARKTPQSFERLHGEQGMGEASYNESGQMAQGAGAYGSQAASILIANRMDLLLKKLETLFHAFEANISSTTRLNDLLGFGPRMKETGERTLEEIRSLVSGSTEQQLLVQQLVDANRSLAATITGILDTQRRGQSELSSVLKQIADRLVTAEEVHISGSRHLWEIKENLGKFGASYGMIEMISSSIGHQTLLFEALMEELRNVKEWYGIGAGNPPQNS